MTWSNPLAVVFVAPHFFAGTMCVGCAIEQKEVYPSDRFKRMHLCSQPLLALVSQTYLFQKNFNLKCRTSETLTFFKEWSYRQDNASI